MTETSAQWDGTVTGDAATYAAAYCADEVARWIRGVSFLYDHTSEGPIYSLEAAYNGQLACTNPAGIQIQVATGRAIVNGWVYENDAAVTLNPGGGNGFYRVVLQLNTTLQTVRAVLTYNAVATPSLVQTATTWEIGLANFEVAGLNITPAGVIDERNFVGETFFSQVLSSDNDGIEDVITMGVTVNTSVGAADLGPSLLAVCHDAGGNLKEIGRLVFRLNNAAAANTQSRIELVTISQGGNVLSGVISGYNGGGAIADGNARGGYAVDFQGNRSAVAQVASGDGSVIGGGSDNTSSGDWATVSGGNQNTATNTYAAVGGGQANDATATQSTIGGGGSNTASGDVSTVAGGSSNTASGDYSGIPGGRLAVADKRAQIASASTFFASGGDSQGTIQMVASSLETHGDATWRTLYLDGTGASERMTISADTAWTFHILVVGITQNAAKQWSYEINGIIERDNANNTTLAASNVTTIFESDANFAARVVADDVNEALAVQVSDSGGSGDVVRWVATIRTSEVSYP